MEQTKNPKKHFQMFWKHWILCNFLFLFFISIFVFSNFLAANVNVIMTLNEKQNVSDDTRTVPRWRARRRVLSIDCKKKGRMWLLSTYTYLGLQAAGGAKDQHQFRFRFRLNAPNNRPNPWSSENYLLSLTASTKMSYIVSRHIFGFLCKHEGCTEYGKVEKNLRQSFTVADQVLSQVLDDHQRFVIVQDEGSNPRSPIPAAGSQIIAKTSLRV